MSGTSFDNLAEGARTIAMCKAIAKMIKSGAFHVPDDGVPIYIGGLRLLVTKEQQPESTSRQIEPAQ